MWRRKRCLSPIAIGALLFAGFGCTEPETRPHASKFEILIEADSAVRTEVADVEARLERRADGDAGWRLRVAQHFYPSKSADWPLSFMSEAEMPSSVAKYQLVAIARDSRGAVVAQARLLTDFESARKSGIRVLFEAACLRLPEICGADLTCHRGDCVSAQYDSSGQITSAETATDAGVDSGKGRDESAVATGDTSCDEEGERRCADFTSSTPLRCTDGVWRSQPECGPMQRCDTSEGPQRGTCRAIAAECVGHKPLEPFCDSEMMLVCDSNLLDSSVRTCFENERCAPDAKGEAHCSCKAGFVKVDEKCERAKDCDDNGGCDPLTTCSATSAGRKCGDCPAGWGGSGESGCIPALVDLKAMDATLSPAFSPDVLKYELRVGLLQQTITFVPAAPKSASVALNGDAAESGKPWTSPVLALGENVVEVQVSSGFGLSKSYRVVVRREGLQQAYLKPERKSDLTTYGYASGVSGDTVVIGAPYDDVNASGINATPADGTAPNSGAAHVYVRDGDSWKMQAYIKAPAVRSEDYLGYSAAISGDTIAVGVPGQVIPATPTMNGLVYVYTRTNGTWSLQAKLAASDSAEGDGFGYYLALDGDRLVVGAPTQVTLGLRGGAVYVFNRANGAWTEQQRVTAADVHAYSGFGSTLTFAGDSLVVGAHADDATSGAAYAFTLSNGRWVQRQKLIREPEVGGAGFSYGLSMTADMLVVGAPRDTDNAGELHVYARVDEMWKHTMTLMAPAPKPSDAFGVFAELTNDVLLVGAPGDSSSARGIGAEPGSRDASGSGAVHLYARSGDGYRLSTTIKASNAHAGDAFGLNMAASGGTIVIGAPNQSSSALGINPTSDDASSMRSGAAYIFR